MTTLLHRIQGYRPFTVMLVGDFMLDQHVYGAAERLSPDAPVPVLHVTGTDNYPGGAAHVSMCLQAMHGTAICVGVVGDDPEGRTLLTTLADAGADVGGFVVDPARPTTIKRSMIGLAQHRHPQKMFRVDVESNAPLDGAVREALVANIEARLAEVDVVCIEDYNKGVCDEPTCQSIIRACRDRNVPVLVDPAAIEDYAKYRGATAITPNRSEAELATGEDTPVDASDLHNSDLAARLLAELDLDVVVLTLDRHGALLQVRDMPPRHIPTIPRNVYDVSGAGDMVLTALAGAIANGLEWSDAVLLANAAAGLEVERFGARPIPFAEVQREVMRLHARLDGKVRTREELAVEVAAHREAGQRVILTNGCFDVIHAGHVAYLREARSLGDVLVVGINADDQVRAMKGDGRPIYSAVERLEILSELQCIDYLTVFEEPTAHELIRAVAPDIYAKGGDYTPDQVAEYDLVQSLGLDLRVLAHRPGRSSTTVIETIRRSEEQSTGGST